jgi:hypothetical protein
LEEESSTASMRCIMARNFPKRLKQNLPTLFVPTHAVLRNSSNCVRIDDVGYAAELGAHV